MMRLGEGLELDPSFVSIYTMAMKRGMHEFECNKYFCVIRWYSLWCGHVFIWRSTGWMVVCIHHCPLCYYISFFLQTLTSSQGAQIKCVFFVSPASVPYVCCTWKNQCSILETAFSVSQTKCKLHAYSDLQRIHLIIKWLCVSLAYLRFFVIRNWTAYRDRGR